MIVIDEYLAVRVVAGDWPEGLPDDEEVALSPAVTGDSSNGSTLPAPASSPESWEH